MFNIPLQDQLPELLDREGLKRRITEAVDHAGLRTRLQPDSRGCIANAGYGSMSSSTTSGCKSLVWDAVNILNRVLVITFTQAIMAVAGSTLLVTLHLIEPGALISEPWRLLFEPFRHLETLTWGTTVGICLAVLSLSLLLLVIEVHPPWGAHRSVSCSARVHWDESRSHDVVWRVGSSRGPEGGRGTGGAGAGQAEGHPHRRPEDGIQMKVRERMLMIAAFS